MPHSEASTLFWVVFLALVLGILFVDLGILHRRAHAIRLRESAWLACGYMGLAILFGFGVWIMLGADDGANYFTAYVVEQSLSVDNVFVMSVIFAYFGVPRQYRHRVLFWGVLGAMVFRGILLGLGATAVNEFEWLLLVFAALLVFTGVKLLLVGEEREPDVAGNPVIRHMARHIPMTTRVAGQRFFVQEPCERGAGSGFRTVATPLFFALVAIEISDLIFAVDSIPAVLAISQDPFIVYTSNIFAILNLRALYFVIDALVARCRYLRPALSAILIFIGGKIFYATFIGEVGSLVSLGVTLALLAIGIGLSLLLRGPIAAQPVAAIEDMSNHQAGLSSGGRR